MTAAAGMVVAEAAAVGTAAVWVGRRQAGGRGLLTSSCAALGFFLFFPFCGVPFGVRAGLGLGLLGLGLDFGLACAGAGASAPSPSKSNAGLAELISHPSTFERSMVPASAFAAAVSTVGSLTVVIFCSSDAC